MPRLYLPHPLLHQSPPYQWPRTCPPLESSSYSANSTKRKFYCRVCSCVYAILYSHQHTLLFVSGGKAQFMLRSMRRLGCAGTQYTLASNGNFAEAAFIARIHIVDPWKFVNCVPCVDPIMGANNYKDNGTVEVCMCQNNITTKKAFETVKYFNEVVMLTFVALLYYVGLGAWVNTCIWCLSCPRGLHKLSPSRMYRGSVSNFLLFKHAYFTHIYARTQVRAANLSGDCTYVLL